MLPFLIAVIEDGQNDQNPAGAVKYLERDLPHVAKNIPYAKIHQREKFLGFAADRQIGDKSDDCHFQDILDEFDQRPQ